MRGNHPHLFHGVCVGVQYSSHDRVNGCEHTQAGESPEDALLHGHSKSFPPQDNTVVTILIVVTGVLGIRVHCMGSACDRFY